MRRPLLFLCVCLFVVIALCMHFFMPPPWDSYNTVSVGQRVCISGQVYDKECGTKEDRETIVLYLQDILISGETSASRQVIIQEENQVSLKKSKEKIKCEIYVDELPCTKEGTVYLPCLGNRIVVEGEWRIYQSATNPGEFDVAKYYAIENVVGYLAEGKLLQADASSRWSIREGLHRVRQALVSKLYEVFDGKEASILAKMLLGDGRGLDPEIRDLYQENGIVHILSISGLHISMLGMGLYHLLRKCGMPVKGAALLGGILVVIYGVLTGFGISSCRAVGMYLIHMLGEIWKKTYDMLTAMGVLMVGMVISNPRLVYHSGYLLSFASVCGVGLLSPILAGWFQFGEPRPYDSLLKKWWKKRFAGICSGLRVSMAVTFFTLPIQLFFFFKIPVYAVFLNLLVVPLVGVIMVLGFIILLVPFSSFLCPCVSAIFVWFEYCCHFFEYLPGHTLLTGCPDFKKIIVYYLGILLIVFTAKHTKRIVVAGGLFFCVLLLVITFHKDNKITFLDVGQGDCICVQTAEGKCFLFDGGSSSKHNVGEKIILPFLQHEGISVVDGVFLSHADADHVNGILQLLEGKHIKVNVIILPDIAEKEKEFEAVAGTIENANSVLSNRRKTEVLYASEGMFFEQENLLVKCLHPQRGYSGEENEYSACYYLELSETEILLTGDIEGEGEAILTDSLLKNEVQGIDILKVAHHGSKNATSEEFLRVLQPKNAIISCGKNNRYGHPHAETVERLKAVGCSMVATDECGSITIVCKQRRTVWKCYRGSAGK